VQRKTHEEGEEPDGEPDGDLVQRSPAPGETVLAALPQVRNHPNTSVPIWASATSRAVSWPTPVSPIQPKLTVGAADDPLEEEADTVADHVVGTEQTRDGGVSVGEPPEPLDEDEGANVVRRARAVRSMFEEGWEDLVERALPGGYPIPRCDQELMEGRFGTDFGGVRIHDDDRSHAAARALGARAFTLGSDIVLGAGQYAQGSSRGQHLLAHELTHVVQQRKGLALGGFAQRQPARAKKPTFQFTVVPPSTMNAKGFRVFVSMQIFGVDATTAADFAVRYTWTGLQATKGVAQGDIGKSITMYVDAELYRSIRGGRDGGATIGVEAAGGTDAATRAAEFDTLPTDVKDALNREVDRRFWDRTRHKPGVKLGPSAADRQMAELWLDMRDEVLLQRKALQDLPPDVQKALGGLASFKPMDYPQLTRIAGKLAPGEWSDYLSRVTVEVTSLDQLEASVDAYIQRRRQTEAQGAKFREQHFKLAGLESLYDAYLDYAEKRRVATEGTIIVGPASAIRLPPGPPQIEAANQAEQRLTASLVAAGLKGGIPEFEASMAAFLEGFEAQTVQIGITTLDRYESFLYRQSQYYSDDAVVQALYESLAPFRASYRQYEAETKAMNEATAAYGRQFEQGRLPGSSHAPDPALREQALAAERGALAAKEQAKTEVQALAGTHPIFKEEHLPIERRIPKEELAKADKEGIKRILRKHIAARTEDVVSARKNLEKDPESIYKMGELMAEARHQLEITPNSIYAKLIDAKIKKIERDETLIAIVVGVLAIAFSILTLGTGAIAVVGALGSLAVGSVAAYQEFERYRVSSAQAGSGLSSEEPSPAWLVISVLGVAADAAVALKAVRALALPARTLEAGGDIGAFRTAVRELEKQGQIEAKMARSVEAAGDARKAYEAASQELRTALLSKAYSFPGPLADPDVYKAVVKMAAAKVRQGIESVNQFILELNKLRVEAKLAELSGDELALAKKAFLEGSESAKVGTYTTRIQWGIQSIEARPSGPGFWGKRTVQTNARVNAYELKINPHGESYYLPHPTEGGFVQFENLAGSTVQDGKLVMSPRSLYHVEDMPAFARQRVMDEARRQVEAAKAAGFSVEWLVSESRAETQLRALFSAEGIPIRVAPLAE
jgi:hypothetical protein